MSKNVSSSPDQPMTMDAALLAGAVSALRRSAASQAAKTRAGTARTESGGLVRTCEAAIASRLAEALAALAEELERGCVMSEAAADVIETYELKPGKVIQCLGCGRNSSRDEAHLTRIVSGTGNPS